MGVMDMDLLLLSLVVMDDQNGTLIKVMIENKIKEAIKSIHPNKASRLNAFLNFFF